MTEEKKPDKLKEITQAFVKKAEAVVQEGTVSEESRLLGVLCYIVQVFMPLFILITEKKNDKYLSFHAYQSLIFSATVIVYYVWLVLFGFVLAMIARFAADLVVALLALLPWVAVVFIAWKVYPGKKYMLPVIGETALKLAKQ